MHVAVVHHEVIAEAPVDELDVLKQVGAVCDALRLLGHRVSVEACSLDLENIRRRLTRLGVDSVFNLVETLNGSGRLIHLFPSVLEASGIPYTGSGSLATVAASNKAVAKWILSASGVATPEWVGPFPADSPRCGRLTGESAGGGEGEEQWIVKSVWEHASVGLDENSIVKASGSMVRGMLPDRSGPLGGSCFAERFVDGREFNLSVLSGVNGPEVLPAAEILFVGFADGAPRIVDYRAKWDETSDAWINTPRRFDTAPADRELLERLEGIALRCWEVFNLRGYARVDFRVDRERVPWVLEVNTNPCLSPDAGFAAALDRAGIPFASAVERILADAFLR